MVLLMIGWLVLLASRSALQLSTDYAAHSLKVADDIAKSFGAAGVAEHTEVY